MFRIKMGRKPHFYFLFLILVLEPLFGDLRDRAQHTQFRVDPSLLSTNRHLYSAALIVVPPNNWGAASTEIKKRFEGKLASGKIETKGVTYHFLDLFLDEKEGSFLTVTQVTRDKKWWKKIPMLGDDQEDEFGALAKLVRAKLEKQILNEAILRMPSGEYVLQFVVKDPAYVSFKLFYFEPGKERIFQIDIGIPIRYYQPDKIKVVESIIGSIRFEHVSR